MDASQYCLLFKTQLQTYYTDLVGHLCLLVGHLCEFFYDFCKTFSVETSIYRIHIEIVSPQYEGVDVALSEHFV